jgi:transposase
MSSDLCPDGVVRLVQRGDRRQQRMIFGCLDDQLPEDHRARVVEAAVAQMDLAAFFQEIRSTKSGGGRPAHDPAALMGLWLLATLDGYGSARELARLVVEHVAYQWLAQGVEISHHALSSFRVDHGEKLDELLTKMIAGLMSEGLVTVEQVAQDGVRVRASAGAASFRRIPTLQEALVAAERQIAALKVELEQQASASHRRRDAARQRAARERAERIQRALEIAQQREPTATGEVRASTTDPEARVMKHGDGGFRPSYNVQLATDVGSQVIVAVSVGQEGSDLGQAAPLHQQVRDRTDRTPTTYLADAGYVKLSDIDAISDAGSTVVMPTVRARKPDQRTAHQPRPDDSPAVSNWRQRMGEAANKALYHLRAATAECVNAHLRNRGLRAFNVRGQTNATTCVLWHALAHNLLRCAVLRTPAIA